MGTAQTRGSNKMNDLEICKRIAEIENLDIAEYKGSIVDKPKTNVTMLRKYDDLNDKVKEAYHKLKDYDPLTDDALCFQLMIKHKISLLDEYLSGDSGKWVAERHHTYMVSASSKNPNKAVCLAIIKCN